MRILMGTVMAKLVVTSIVEESVPVELQAALFDLGIETSRRFARYDDSI